MFQKLLGRLLPSAASAPTTDKAEADSAAELPRMIEAAGVSPLDFEKLLIVEQGLPVPDWDAVLEWTAGIRDAAERDRVWGEIEVAWLVHLRAALGPHYRLVRRGSAIVLSSLEGVVAVAAAQFINAAQQRIVTVLDGVAEAPGECGYDILVVFDDEETYYDYVSRYYPQEGEFAFSAGMFINDGCGHFVTRKANDLKDIEPTIVHELTHASLTHLSIPLWLNEGLAVNTEAHLSGGPNQRHTSRQRDAMHRKFWNERTIQEFWAGHSFHRPDEGNMLSYDLAQLLVRHLSADWPQFARFANAADALDGGDAAAREALGVDLGELVKALFEVESGEPQGRPTRWSPDPSSWGGDGAVTETS
ncbi:hypothetical protein [Diaphorobacter caeni]|uniref:hypothetical protein n=1 Tax=Diaphorobacter caeni TaxID=2784387 RepID=UPI00188E1FD7|nr:hypothetical protein [Diaphorobacter caeni]MBF5003212.1 hypothetical protein [Diaphorobacter caeni]